MRLRSVVLGIVAAASVAGVAMAEGPTPEAIANRIEVMKVTVSGAVRTASMMAMGKQPYDAKAAKGAMETIATALSTFPALFPPGSEGVKDRASPDIWKNFDDFKARAAKLETDAKAAAAASDKGLEAFKTAFNVAGANCQGCHEKYRAEQ